MEEQSAYRMYDLREMEEHDIQDVNGDECQVMKVPGGWIYIFRNSVYMNEFQEHQWQIVSTEFVPEPKREENE